MRYGQDCVSILVWFGLSLGCIVGVFQGLMRVAQLDKGALDEGKYCEVSQKCIGIVCVLGAMWVCGITLKVNGVREEMMQGVFLCKNRKGMLWDTITSRGWLTIHIILLSIIVACLLTASVMDIETRLIYNYVWWLGACAGISMMLLCDSRMWLSVLLFGILQEYLFSKMYGRADCHGFVACALAEAALGMGMREYLLHMLIAFGILGMIQLLKGNVGRNGNLRKPIPFLPYITVAFGVNLVAYLCV